MGRLVRDARLESREARLRLKLRKEPYWRLIIEGVHLGYYKGNNGGMWYVRVRLPEKKYSWQAIATADDSTDANGETILNFSQAQDHARQIADKIHRGDDRSSSKPYTVKDATEDYLLDFKASGKKSLYSTEAQINAHILPVFGNKLVALLNFKELNVWKNKLATTHKRARTGLGNPQQYNTDENNDPEYQRRRRATANRIVTILKAILNHAYKTDRVKSNEVWQKLQPFKNVSEAKIRFLSEDESQCLMNACEANFRLLVRGALLTGARYGELSALKAGDYSQDNQTIFIHQSKSGKPRHVPLNTEGIKFFDQLTLGKNPEALIFVRNDSSSWNRSYQIRPLVEACKNARISPSITFHHLRHTYASALAMKGVPLQVIAAVLGHSDTRVTHKHYAHLMPSYIADVIKEHLPDFGKTEETNMSPLRY